MPRSAGTSGCDEGHVELGFPHDFYARDLVNGMVYGGLRDKIDV